MPKLPVIVATSGYFDPLHVGHISCFEDARKLGTKLVVIINNDNQIILKKGFYFMPVNERIKIIQSLRVVDEVIVSVDSDDLVCETLKLIKPQIFAKGGEWRKENMPRRMVETCKELGCEIVWGLGENPVVHSGSKYIARIISMAKQEVI